MASDGNTKVPATDVSDSDSDGPVLPGSLTNTPFNTPVPDSIGLRHRNVPRNQPSTNPRGREKILRISRPTSQLQEGSQGLSTRRTSQAPSNEGDGNARVEGSLRGQQTASVRSQGTLQGAVSGEPESPSGSENQGGPQWLYPQILSSKPSSGRGGGASSRGGAQKDDVFDAEYEEGAGRSQQLQSQESQTLNLDLPVTRHDLQIFSSSIMNKFSSLEKDVAAMNSTFSDLMLKIGSC